MRRIMDNAALLRIAAMRRLRRLVDRVGGVLLSKPSYAALLAQRDRAVIALREPLQAALRPGLTGIAFSRDRAHQLDVLLRTYVRAVRNPACLHVIYSASNDDHLGAYAALQASVEEVGIDVRFVREADGFRATLLATLQQIDTRNVFFLVDDIVFLREVDLDCARMVDPLAEILSFRHSPHLRRSYTSHQRQMPPSFSASDGNAGMLSFEWFVQGNEWSDPWSVDGQILSTAEVRILASVSDFRAPNTFEAALKSFGSLCVGRRGACFAESIIVNLPLNRVQTEVSNLSGSVSPEYLLAKWNEGLILDVAPLWGHVPQAPHEEHVLGFVQRPPFPRPGAELYG